MTAAANALVTTDINARLMPGSVVTVRDTNGYDVAFAAVPTDVDGDTDWWTRIDTALRQVGWSTVGAGYIPGPGIATFTAVPAADTVWRRRTIRFHELKVGDQILWAEVNTVTYVGHGVDEFDARTWVCTDLAPDGRAYYSSDQVTVLVTDRTPAPKVAR